MVDPPWWTRSRTCAYQRGLPSSHSQTHLLRGLTARSQQPCGSRPNQDSAATPARPSPPVAPPARRPRPHLHVHRLLQRQADRVAAVRTQHRAERAHAAAAAATEELGHAVAVLRAAPAARVLALRGARLPRCPALRPCARHSTFGFGRPRCGGGAPAENRKLGGGAGRPRAGPAPAGRIAARARPAIAAVSAPCCPAGCAPAASAPAASAARRVRPRLAARRWRQPEWGSLPEGGLKGGGLPRPVLRVQSLSENCSPVGCGLPGGVRDRHLSLPLDSLCPFPRRNHHSHNCQNHSGNSDCPGLSPCPPNVNWYSQHEKHYGVSSKNEKWNYPMISNLPSGYIWEDYEVSIWKRYLHSWVQCSIIHNSQDVETTSVLPGING